MIMKASEIPSRQTRPGVVGKEPKLAKAVVFSEWSFAEGIEVLPHKHDNESYGYIVKGKLLVRLNNEDDQILGEGDLFFLRPGTEHYLRAVEDTVIVYASSPPGA